MYLTPGTIAFIDNRCMQKLNESPCQLYRHHYRADEE